MNRGFLLFVLFLGACQGGLGGNGPHGDGGLQDALSPTKNESDLDAGSRIFTVTCLGDSITYGVGDPLGNGYRLELNRLVSGDFTPRWIGAIVHGSPPSDHSEGGSGSRTSTWLGTIPLIFPAQIGPDIVVVLLGMNDTATDASAIVFQSNYTLMMTKLHTQLPRAGFVVSPITSTTDAEHQARISVANADLSATWAQLAANGLIMERAEGVVFVRSELADGVHPNPLGYLKLARALSAPLVRLAARL